MQFLPHESLTYETKLTTSEIQESIANVIEPNKLLRTPVFFREDDMKPYEGWLRGNSFKVNRLIMYRNSFLPTIKGEIVKEYRGAKVHITMRLHTFVLVFMLIWLGGVFAFCIAALFTSAGGEMGAFILVPFGMLLFGYGLSTAAFKYESKKSKAFFAEVLEVEGG